MALPCCAAANGWIAMAVAIALLTNGSPTGTAATWLRGSEARSACSGSLIRNLDGPARRSAIQ
eukprot:14799165-Alexandrium_andersonii.AAC.1